MKDLPHSAVCPAGGPHHGADEKPLYFCLDVDGMMTTGDIGIPFITGDRKGDALSCRRIVNDMKMSLDLVSTYTACFDLSEG